MSVLKDARLRGRRRRRRPAPPEEITNLIAQAVVEITEQKYESVFVTQERASAKRYRIPPSDRMERLRRWIEQNGPVTYHASLGMNWTTLGGLLTRRLVETYHDENGPDGKPRAMVRVVGLTKAR